MRGVTKCRPYGHEGASNILIVSSYTIYIVDRPDKHNNPHCRYAQRVSQDTCHSKPETIQMYHSISNKLAPEKEKQIEIKHKTHKGQCFSLVPLGAPLSVDPFCPLSRHRLAGAGHEFPGVFGPRLHGNGEPSWMQLWRRVCFGSGTGVCVWCGFWMEDSLLFGFCRVDTFVDVGRGTSETNQM